MQRMFGSMMIGNLTLANRFIFPPIKTAYGTPKGDVTERHLTYYRQIAKKGPALVILEPVAVTADGKEHPKQLCIHLPESASELKKIADVIHEEDRLACLHLNHAGAAANPKATGVNPKPPPPSPARPPVTTADPLSEEEIQSIVDGYRAAAEKAVTAGFDMIEIQAGHGYLVSQFLNGKSTSGATRYGENRLLFAREVFAAVKKVRPELAMHAADFRQRDVPEFGISQDDLTPLLNLAENSGSLRHPCGHGVGLLQPTLVFSPLQPAGKTSDGCAGLGTCPNSAPPDRCRSHGPDRSDGSGSRQKTWPIWWPWGDR